LRNAGNHFCRDAWRSSILGHSSAYRFDTCLLGTIKPTGPEAGGKEEPPEDGCAQVLHIIHIPLVRARKPLNGSGFPACVSDLFSWPFAGWKACATHFARPSADREIMRDGSAFLFRLRGSPARDVALFFASALLQRLFHCLGDGFGRNRPQALERR